MMAGLPTRHTFSANPTSINPIITPNKTKIGNNILNVLISLENNGKSKSTIQCTDKILTYISRKADLENPEEVKHYIAQKQCSKSYKKNMCLAYNRYCQYHQIEWTMPKYKPEQHLIRIPTKQKLEMIIANSGRKMATKLKLSLETGLRPIELVNLKVKDIDLEQRKVYPTTAKNGAPRTLKISKTLQNMLTDYIIREKLNQNDRLFDTTPRGYSKMYRVTRNKLAKKLQDPTIKNNQTQYAIHYAPFREAL